MILLSPLSPAYITVENAHSGFPLGFFTFTLGLLLWLHQAAQFSTEYLVLGRHTLALLLGALPASGMLTRHAMDLLPSGIHSHAHRCLLSPPPDLT
jgi:hypothetical protein